jgi:hypothetical protein
MMGADRDHQSVDELSRPAHDIDMAKGDGIEAPWVKA